MLRNATLKTLLMATTIAIATSCDHESYETGDGDLSYMRADYADITVTASAVTDITTDDGLRLIPPKGLGVSSDMPADTMLRRLIHYNLTDSAAPIELLKLTPVAVITPHDKSEIEQMKTDPVTLTAVWMSANKRYINLHLGVKTGNSNDSTARQKLQIVRDSTHNNGRGAAFLTLYHDQADIPQYYTQDTYISIPTNSINNNQTQPDTVTININTYKGTKVTRIIVGRAS